MTGSTLNGVAKMFNSICLLFTFLYLSLNDSIHFLTLIIGGEVTL